MFTGITEVTGEIIDRSATDAGVRLSISCPSDWELTIGQSIAVSGACLTVVAHESGSFSADVIPETLSRTTLGDKGVVVVNLERAMPATGRFEGHVVQGHVDTIGKIESVIETDGASVWKFSFPAEFQPNVVPKGSIAIDGISLTVVEVGSGFLTVSLIPHTLQITTLGHRKVGDAVQLEFDIMGKYFMNNQQNHG